MNNLFDKTDVLTVVTAEQAKVGDRGYFGNSWLDLQEAIKNNYLASIATIFTGRCDCFMNNVENTIYGLFLPANKVNQPAKEKEKVYREIRNIDDLSNLLQPFVLSDVTEERKIDALLGKRIEIKHVTQNHSCHVIIQSIGYNEVLRKMTINDIDTLTLGNYYKIKLEGEWRPFAVEYDAEEQGSERSKEKDVDTSLSDFMDKRIKEISEEE